MSASIHIPAGLLVHACWADIDCRKHGPAKVNLRGSSVMDGQMAKYSIGLLFVLGLMSMPAAEASVVPGEEHCVINVPSWDMLNIRSGPSTTAQIISRKPYGSCGITVVENCRAQWCPVEDGHMRGWANRRFLSMVSPSLYCTVGLGRRSVVKLRAFPSPQSRVIVALDRPTCGIAFLPYARGIWQKIRVNGWEGWITRGEVSGQ